MWTAIVPLKRSAAAKSRLAPCLSQQARRALSDRMAGRVIDALSGASCISDIRILTRAPCPKDDPAWEPDHGEGLNQELRRLRGQLADRPLLVIHGDLPLVTAAEIQSLCEEGGRRGIALAPDREDIGTNAIALRPDRPFTFAFGDRSFPRHRLTAGPDCGVARARGLTFDVDDPDDLADLLRIDPAADWIAIDPAPAGQRHHRSRWNPDR